MVMCMYTKEDLVYNDYFGYGIILSSTESNSEVYFQSGKKTIMNTHLDLQDYDREKVEELKKIYTKELKEKENEKRERSEKERKKRERQIQRNTELEINKQLKKYSSRLQNIKKYITEDLYKLNYVKSIFKRNGIPITEEVLNYGLAYLGYRLRTKEIVLHKHWSSIEHYYENLILKYDRYFYKNKYKLSNYDSILKRLEQKLIMFEAAPGVYITKKLMEREGIYLSTIKNFHEILRKIGTKHNFFSIKIIKNYISNNNIIKFSSDEYLLNSIILSASDIKSIKTDDDKYIYTFIRKRISRPYFIEYILNKLGSIDIYDLREYIKEIYDVKFNNNSIFYCINNSSLYYCEEMEKVYKNKELYIEEVYK